MNRVRVESRVCALVKRIHLRNAARKWSWDRAGKILGGEYIVDSLDFAEIVTTLELESGVRIGEADPFPRTWNDLIRYIEVRLQNQSG